MITKRQLRAENKRMHVKHVALCAERDRLLTQLYSVQATLRTLANRMDGPLEKGSEAK